jgi:hypothetical protein
VYYDPSGSSIFRVSFWRCLFCYARTDCGFWFQFKQRAVGFSPHIWDPFGAVRRFLSGSEESVASWEPLKEALEKVAFAFLQRHKRPLVLIIDAADLIAEDDPSFFRHLQGFAKAGAGKGTMRVVFVCSESAALSLLQSNSAWRAKPYEIGDVIDSLAIDYLVRRNVPADRATNAVATVTGGRYTLLTQYADAFTIKTVEEWRDELYDRLLSTLVKLEISPKNPAFNWLG